jgi:hypothetical protein
MTKTNSALMKADIALADIQSAGLLEPEQAQTFIRKLIKSPTIIKVARVVEMTSPQRNINKIQFGSRILRPAVSATALSSGDRSKPTTSQVQLNTKEVIAEIHIPYDVMEDNVERASVAGNELPNTGPGGLRDTIIQLIGERAALDIEELALLGDTTSGDAYLALFNGYLKLAVSGGNIVDNGGGTVDKTMFKNAMKVLPDQYLRNKAAMSHFVSTNNQTEYTDTIASRPGALGDSLIQGTSVPQAYGVPVTAVPLMPESQGLFCDPLNLILGIQRQISLEYDKDIAARVYIIVLTCRLAIQIEETLALVAYQNIGS